MTKEEFERRIGVVLKTTASLLGGSGVDSKSPEAGGMTQSEAVAFYEHVVEQLDARLEDMIEAWKPGALSDVASEGTSEKDKEGLG